MTPEKALSLMKLPKHLRGPRHILQVWVTRSCDKACCHCTQGSNFRGNPGFITPEQFLQACVSMNGYPGVVAMFGGNPCIHPKFEELCEIARKHIPYRYRGIWTNNLLGKGKICRQTFNPNASNFNLHLDQKAAEEFRRDWPETRKHLKGLDHDCGHSPVFTAMKDLPDISSEEMWEMISKCDINQKWSAMIGVFRGELRGWFCEIAGAQSILHQDDPSYPDTGLKIEPGWWLKNLDDFQLQIMKHCPECGVPLRALGQKATQGCKEQVSLTHLSIARPKRKDVTVEQISSRADLGSKVPHVTDYLANYKYQEKS